MENPWKEISLADYENHMKLDSVMQLQVMNEMMKGQFYTYPVSSIMILGIAGGNGLEHIQKDRFDKNRRPPIVTKLTAVLFFSLPSIIKNSKHKNIINDLYAELTFVFCPFNKKIPFILSIIGQNVVNTQTTPTELIRIPPLKAILLLLSAIKNNLKLRK